jgi:hypothetical protein
VRGDGSGHRPSGGACLQGLPLDRGPRSASPSARPPPPRGNQSSASTRTTQLHQRNVPHPLLLDLLGDSMIGESSYLLQTFALRFIFLPRQRRSGAHALTLALLFTSQTSALRFIFLPRPRRSGAHALTLALLFNFQSRQLRSSVPASCFSHILLLAMTSCSNPLVSRAAPRPTPAQQS